MDIMNVLRTGMNMSISHIFMYGYVTDPYDVTVQRVCQNTTETTRMF